MKISIFDINFDNLSSAKALEELIALRARGGYIVTPNPEFVVRSLADSKLKNIINRADISLIDGIGIVWAAKILGKGNVIRISGIDFMEMVIKMSNEKGWRIGLLGGKGNTAQRLAKLIVRSYPAISVPFAMSGSPNSSRDGIVRDKISGLDLDFLFVAYGNPKQEYWIDRNLGKVDAKVLMGVGGSFDYLTGNVKRAPKLLRRLGLEWLYRLFVQPWRIKRQLSLGVFVLMVLKKRLFG